MSQKENVALTFWSIWRLRALKIGTRDYKGKPLDRLDELAEQIQTASSALRSCLQAEFEQVEAQEYVKQNELGQIVEQSGGVV